VYEKPSSHLEMRSGEQLHLSIDMPPYRTFQNHHASDISQAITPTSAPLVPSLAHAAPSRSHVTLVVNKEIIQQEDRDAYNLKW
jgi:hypothetical protein